MVKYLSVSIFYLSFVICHLSFLSTSYAANFPQPQGYVNDFANVISIETRQQIESVLTNFESSTTCEIAVVTVSSLEGLAVEDYAVELFKKWGIGEKGKDNGVLLLVAPNDHKLRIEVGYGLEPVLPDGRCGEIIRSVVPYFKQNDYSNGISKAVQEIMDTITGKSSTTFSSEDLEKKVRENISLYKPVANFFLFLIPFLAIGGFIMGNGLRAISRRGSKGGVFALIFGLLFGGIPFGLYTGQSFHSIPVAIIKIMVGIHLAILFGGFVIGLLGFGILFMLLRAFMLSGVGYGSGSSGGFGGGGFGGGGFGGFGGGSSGGGGASGSW